MANALFVCGSKLTAFRHAITCIARQIPTTNMHAHRLLTPARAGQRVWQTRPFSLSRSIRQDNTQSVALEAPEFLDEREREVFQIVKHGLSPTKLEVQDVSGGCGSMYAIEIVSEKFRGLSMIKQHRLVNSILEDKIKTWHGVRLNTRAP